MHHIPLYGRVAWSSTYTWCTQKSRAADERQRVSDMPTNSTTSTTTTKYAATKKNLDIFLKKVKKHW